MAMTYKVEISNKIERGRTVGTLFGVGCYIDGRRAYWALKPQESEDKARKAAVEMSGWANLDPFGRTSE